jgi:hypothetical protein
MSIVTNSNWGPHLFDILTVVFLVSTILLARSLGIVMDTWNQFVELFWKKVKPDHYLDLNDDENEEIKPMKKIEEALKKDGISTAIQSAKSWPMLHIKRRKTITKADQKEDVERQSVNGKVQESDGLKATTEKNSLDGKANMD